MDNIANILVVDDEPNGFDVIEGILFTEGYQLQYSASGVLALKRLENQQIPDLILLDVMMPDLDGLEVCRRIKANNQWSHIPIIMVTALSSPDDLARCLGTGADDFIGKPVNATELRARIRSMLRIKRQHDELQATLQLRKDMADMIVHDLRNPIMAIDMACAILKRSELTDKQKRKIEQIISGGKQLETLANSLLMLAKIESGKLLLNLDMVDFNNLVKTVVNNYYAIAEQKNISIEMDLADPGQQLAIDSLLIGRVIENLLSNSIKYSLSKSQVKITVEYPKSNQTILQIYDQGYGIKDEIKEKIFAKYEIGNIIKNATQTGLGLAFCKMAVEAHHGNIKISDNQPQGSIFTMELGSKV